VSSDTLLDRAADEDVSVIYVNDNYGDWNSSADAVAHIHPTSPTRR